MKLKFIYSFLVIFLFAASFLTLRPQDAWAARTILFPVIGQTSFSNDYNAPRSNGPHHAIDIIANKRQKLIAVKSGTITYVAYPQPSWGYMLSIRDDDGFRYNYLHINNDNPGTDDGNGGGMNAYAVDMQVGNRVTQGQLIGWVGDSGNAENTVSHLHFEMIQPNGNVMNPYNSLIEAKHRTTYVTYPALANEILPYGPSKIGINTAMGNFDGDLTSELVSGAGKGGSSLVRRYESNRTLVDSFYVYEDGGNFRGGVDVAAADVDGDDIDEIISGAGPGGNPNVRVFKLSGGSVTMIADFKVYTSFKGGINVAAGDIDGDGLAEVITSAGPGGSPNVRAYKIAGGTATMVSDFNVYGTFKGGIDVAAADVAGTNSAEIITGAGPGGSPNVRVFDLDGNLHSSFNGNNSNFKGGVRVSAGNVRTDSSKAEILTVPASSGRPIIRMYTHNGGFIDDDMFMEEWWSGYHDVAAGFDTSFGATGINRRASIRFGIQ